ncbi:hypothetical protein EMCRGX_G025639 [Ephydatia muelleri]
MLQCDRKRKLCVLRFDQATRQSTCLGQNWDILFSFTVTRWSSLMFLLSLKDAVHDVLQEIPDLEAQELTIREYQSLQSHAVIVLINWKGKIAQHYHQCTLVAIVELRHHLEQTVSAAQGTVTAARQLIADINRQFNFVFNHQNPDFKPIYCIATYLDPRFRSILRVLNLMDVAMDNARQNYGIHTIIRVRRGRATCKAHLP